MSADDRTMFSPLRRGETASPEAKVLGVLATYDAGATARVLAVALAQAGLAVGTRMSLTKRVGELLASLEGDGRVERTPDGRYRTTVQSR